MTGRTRRASVSRPVAGAPGADWRMLNRAHWDELVPLHLSGSFYDVAGFRRRPDVLRDFEADELGPVDGRSLLHLQCHFGLDTLSWASRGARVTGLDFSAVAVAAARALAVEVGAAARFVAADVYDAVEALDGQRFDVVYTGLGALCWLPDLEGWARVVRALLRDGGVLYLVEFHPFANILDEADGRTVAMDYFDDRPEQGSGTGSYADRAAATAHNVTVQFPHTLGRVLSAIAAVGLRLEFLHEHDRTLFPRFATLHRDPDGYRLPPGQPRVPLMYSLRARA
ncbi:bifunctional 2-polyprenyl-6-hydroxyphenol methylase/3-demethylubiquinol 3-O-methyltransferase UbiG [Frankia sp. R82]|uniref:class I SAM-dependent methyltransferase n=1 Tax=Frankia sp. R82 TaxID=2950553 RepID=UPI002044A9A7|nr:class I SAM-dependent methyltransferase [Frankia sp. R82]MCM3884570.1 class I SAM-dependent methyltransferase [Frankia sp. R82]